VRRAYNRIYLDRRTVKHKVAIKTECDSECSDEEVSMPLSGDMEDEFFQDIEETEMVNSNGLILYISQFFDSRLSLTSTHEALLTIC